MPGVAEHLYILDAVGGELTGRLYKLRTELASCEPADLHLSDKMARRVVDKFPTLADVMKAKDPGYDVFFRSTQDVVTQLGPFFALLCQILEFRDHALVLIHEMSVANLALEANEVAFAGYYNLMLAYAKLHMLVGAIAAPSGRGKLALAVYAKAYALMNASQVPHEYELLAKFLMDYEQPLPKLQDDFAKAKLRVADTLLPLGLQVLQLGDSGHLRSETVLSPLAQSAATARAKLEGADHAPQVPPLLARLPEARQWILFGLMLYPDDLAEQGAIDVLMNLLSTTYVLPVYGLDAIHPHTEFDVDSKTLTKWLKRKDEVKRFQTQLKESRISAFRSAGNMHATLRAVLVTKLTNLHAALLDSPSKLCPLLPTLLTALRLAQDEVAWWVLHADAILDELPRKEREAERDAATFHPAGVLSLLRLSDGLKGLLLDQRAKLFEAAAARLTGHHLTTVNNYLEAVQPLKLPIEATSILRELPAHLTACDNVDADLQGLRLNILRVVLELSKPGTFSLLSQSAALTSLVRELHTVTALSYAVDSTESLIKQLEPTELLADASKLDRLFSCAAATRPTDCIMLLRLAARGPSVRSPLPEMLTLLSNRIQSLLRALCDHYRAQRIGQGSAGIRDSAHQLCTLCTTLAHSPMVDASAMAVQFNLAEWLRERIEDFVDAAFALIVFPSASAVEPRAPATALALLSDLTHTLATIDPYTTFDTQALLDSVMARELGTLEIAGADLVAEPTSPGASETAAVRARGLRLEADSATRRVASGRSSVMSALQSPSSRGAEPGRGSLIQRLCEWLRTSIEAAQGLNGPQYLPGRRAFSASLLDATQFGALCRLVGASGTKQLSGVLLEAASKPPATLHGLLMANRHVLSDVVMHFERTCELLGGAVLVEMQMVFTACRTFGVVLAARSLMHQGVAAAKSEMLAPAVPSFVRGLGEQHLPNGVRAGLHVPSVVELLSSFGQNGALHLDASLTEAVAESSNIGQEPELWALLPYALALSFAQPEWGAVAPMLADDTLSHNAHCIVHALHALLCMTEPHMRKRTPDPASGPCITAHTTFLEVSSLVLLQQRRALREAKPSEVPARERMQAAVVLILEKLVQLAETLGYGDLHPFLPYSLVLGAYATISQPVDTVQREATVPRAIATSVSVSAIL